jgi:hypothetical protein
MGWFTDLCRNLGLMVHHVRHPPTDKQVVRKQVQETRQGDVVLRRTTIEEVEIKQAPKSD